MTYGKGKFTGRTDTSGTYVFSYDAQGNLSREDKTVSGILYATQYAYNKDNALTSITYPSGRVITYTRDQAGRVPRSVRPSTAIPRHSRLPSPTYPLERLPD